MCALGMIIQAVLHYTVSKYHSSIAEICKGAFFVFFFVCFFFFFFFFDNASVVSYVALVCYSYFFHLVPLG